MPKVRDILVHVCVETAERRRKCYRNQEHSIRQGERCLVVRTGPTNSKHNYCLQCAKEILGRAGSRLVEIERELGIGDEPSDGALNTVSLEG